MKWDCVTDKLQNNYGKSHLSTNSSVTSERSKRNYTYCKACDINGSEISFKGANISSIEKRGRLVLRQLSKYMKDPDEMVNAAIAAIGTGIIAPIAIMCSGKKKDHPIANTIANTEENEKEKEKFQALRQPISALLAFGFQVPSTIGICKLMNYLAYEKQIDLFKDPILQSIIPDKQYLRHQAKKLLKNPQNKKLRAKWSEELKAIPNFESVKTAFIERVKTVYDDVGINISQKELEKIVNNKRKQITFHAKKLAKAKREKLLDKKVEELLNTKFYIQDNDIVTENFQDLAKFRHKEKLSEIEKNAKLSFSDKIMRLMGLSNKKLDSVQETQKAQAKVLGLEYMKGDSPAAFKSRKERLRKFIENRNAKAQKQYGNKIYWITVLANLFMVAISCVALNELHPRFVELMDKITQSYKAKNCKCKKVQVSA